MSLPIKFLDKHSLKIWNIQETRLQNKNEIPKDFTHLEHLYNIIFCGTDETDPGAGILFCVEKTEKKNIKQKSIVKGRILYIQTKNIVTGNIFNIFSFYGKSNANKAYADNFIS